MDQKFLPKILGQRNLWFVTSVFVSDSLVYFGSFSSQPTRGKAYVEVDTDCKVMLLALSLERVFK